VKLSSLTFLAILAGCSSSTLAGTAAFLPGGRQVARADDDGVVILNLEDHTEATLPQPEGMKLEYPGLAATETLLLVQTKTQVMSWNPESKEWKPFCAAPEGTEIHDVAVNPKTGMLLLVTESEEKPMPAWWILEEGKEQLVHVANRRAEDPECPVFNAAGDLYFCGAGDVWKGDIEIPTEADEQVALEGSRIWPVAEKETANGTPSGVSAQGIVPLKKFLIIDRSRTGGSGWGSIIRLPNADAYEKHLALKWDELADSGSGCNMALSPDGKRAMMYDRIGHHWTEIDVETGKLKTLEDSAPKKKK
jgi:hypothetical protein